jgi:alpha-glucoside transport system permease protein
MKGGGLAPLVLTLICGVWLVPLLGLVVDSFREPFTASRSGWWTIVSDPGALTLDNYRNALDTRGLGTAFGNSLAVAVPAVSMLVSLSAVTAFGLARLTRSRSRGVITGVLLVFASIPIQVVLVPVLRLYSEVGLAGTLPGIWFVHIGLSLPFGVYLLRNVYLALPEELFDAAALDGASVFDQFVRVALPLSRTAMAAVAIFQFIWIWNDLLLALVFLGGDPGVAPVTVTIANLVNATTGQGTQELAAAALVAMSLPMAVYLVLQRFFVRGLLVGSVK